MQLLVPAVSAAQACETAAVAAARKAMDGTSLEPGVRAFVSSRLARPRYFEGDGRGCTAPRLNHPLYPDIPVRDCTYTHLGLTGWLRQANPTADIMTSWVVQACGTAGNPVDCAAQLLASTWCSNQFSYPIAGTVIEPSSSGGGRGAGGTYFVFLHGVTVERPDWLTPDRPVPAEIQRDRLGPLADRPDAFRGAVRQVARPAAIRQDIYVRFGGDAAGMAERAVVVGGSCPPSSRRPAWLTVSREALIEGWRTGHHPLMDAAARALEAGEPTGVRACR